MTKRWIARLFDGPAGRVMAKIMAKGNRDAEAEAVAELAPEPHHRVLAIGFGPGVGVALLAERVPEGSVAGVDPSKVMVKDATRRNRLLVDAGRVELVQAPAHELPWDDSSFDGAVAVNSIQLWEPFDDSVAEVARVLCSGARLVTFTHDWAIRRSLSMDVEAWAGHVADVSKRHGLLDARHWRARAEKGRSVAFVVRRE